MKRKAPSGERLDVKRSHLLAHGWTETELNYARHVLELPDAAAQNIYQQASWSRPESPA